MKSVPDGFLLSLEMARPNSDWVLTSFWGISESKSEFFVLFWTGGGDSLLGDDAILTMTNKSEIKLSLFSKLISKILIMSYFNYNLLINFLNDVLGNFSVILKDFE